MSVYITVYITEYGHLRLQINVFTEDSVMDMIHHSHHNDV